MDDYLRLKEALTIALNTLKPKLFHFYITKNK